jgi:DNA polymerase-3 subunit beta
MRVTVTRRELLEAVQIAARIATTKSTLGQMANVLLTAEGETLKVSASDLSTSIELSVVAKVERAGGTSVPASKFMQHIAGLPEADVNLECGEDGDYALVISCRRSEYKLHGLSPDYFPAFPEVGGDVRVSVSQALLKRAIAQSAYAASDDGARPILTGVGVYLSPDKLVLVGTDTHRMGKAEIPVADGCEARCIIPADVLLQAPRFLNGDENAMASVRLDTNLFLIATEKAVLVSRLIEGQFPRYERVIPSGWDTRITVNRDELAAAVKRLRVEKTEQGSGTDKLVTCRVLCQTELGMLLLSTQGSTGRVCDEVEIEQEGPDITWAVNADYAVEVLESFDTASAAFELKGSLNPIAVRGLGDENAMAVVMPLQTS